jgi:DNA-binding SARP family transcriptional activator/predicted ATPase
MHALTIRLLGPLQIWRHGEPLPPDAWPTQKTRLLLLMLLTERGHSVPKERLMERLWPELTPASAANSLRVNISHLRRLLDSTRDRSAESSLIHTHAEGYRFQSTPDCWIDVDAFWDAVARGQHWARRQMWGLAIAAWQMATDLYHGDYLEDEPYAEWAFATRDHLRDTLLDTLGRLAECHARLGQHHQAIALGEQVLARDPLREDAYRQVMVYHERLGQRAQALRAYERCQRAMHTTLGVDPAPSTQALSSQMLRDEPLDEPILFHDLPGPAAHDAPQQTQHVCVGRQDEIAQLLTHLEHVQHGQGRFVAITGEAGVGKTCLVDALLDQTRDRSVQVLRGTSHEIERDLPFQPIREALRPYLLRHLSPDQARWILGPWAADVALLLPEVRNLMPDLPPAEPVSSEGERQRLLTGLVECCRAIAARYPLVFVLDNLQWSDPSTLQCLHLLVQQISQEPILILGAFRTEEMTPASFVTTLEQQAGRAAPVFRLDLPRLSREAVADLIEQDVAPGWQHEPFVQRLYAETEGNPLFLTEMLRSLRDQGLLHENGARRWHPAPDIDLTGSRWNLPTSVQRVIEHRYQAASDPARRVLQVAAVVDRYITYTLIQQASALPIDDLLDALDELLHRQLLQELPDHDQVWYAFSHDKIREVVYDSLSQARRSHLHRQVAAALEALHADAIETIAGQLAHHATRAGETTQAVTYRLQAGKEALRLSAYAEAIAHLTAGLALLHVLPDTPARQQQELDYQMTLGAAYMATRGYGAPETMQTHERAHTLCQQLGDAPQLLVILIRLWGYYYIRGDLRTATDLAAQCLQIAQRSPESVPLAEMPPLAMGSTLLWRGAAPEAYKYIAQALEVYDPAKRQLSLRAFALDSYTVSLIYMAQLCWLLGHPEQARQRITAARDAGQQLEHPFSHCFALAYAAVIFFLLRDTEAAQEHAAATIALARERGFTQLEMRGLVIQGALQAEKQPAAGIAQIQQGIALAEEMGRTIAQPINLALLGAAYLQAGQHEQAHGALNKALAAVEETDERWYEAEIIRLRGELLRASGAEAEAETSFEQAIAIAQQQHTRAWELRATVSLCRLLQQQGRPDPAHERLAAIIDWFREGQDTPDLREAHALLAARSVP